MASRIYVLKHKHTHRFLSTRVEGNSRPGVVGFTCRKHAMTLKKLMNNHQISVEHFEKDRLVRICRDGYLDVVLYDETGDYQVIDDIRAELMGEPTHAKKDIESARMSLEVAFRYY